jgi:hypothetical protein
MDLPNLFSSGIKAKTEYFVIFVILSDAKLQVSLLELSRGGVQILDKSKEFEYEGLEKCVENTDLALQQLDKRSENVTETIFAVNNSWVTNGEVIDEKKPFVKKLSDDLNLKPLGFIDINESLAQQELDENALYSGIILVFTKLEMLFTLIYQGKILQTESVGKSSDFKSDFDEGIARLKTSVEKKGNYLPPKISLASFELIKKDLSDFQQQIYQQDWKNNSIFLQTPTVEVLSSSSMLEGLSNEAGKNAAVHKGLTDFALAASVSSHSSDTDNEKLNDESDSTQDNPDVTTLNSSEFGFENPLNLDPLESAPTSFGIPIKVNDYKTKIDGENDNLKAVDDDFMNINNKEKIVLDKSKNKKVDWGHKKHVKWFIIIGIILGLVSLSLGLVFGSSFFAKTEVEIVLNKKLVSKEIELTLDTKAKETDVEKLLIAANTVTKVASDTNVIQTTGIKIIGENATGSISIYNKTNAVKVFEKGTQLKFGDLIFTLDDNVTIASASSKQGGEDYGRSDATVTAAQIGAESNLNKDSELVISSYDLSTYNSYVIDQNFVGGSSREVRIVAQKDLDELATDLRNTLLKKINDQFSEESGNGTYILPSKSIIDEKAKFDAELEKEAESVSLELTIEVEAVTYSGGDLKPVAQEILSKDLPENYVLEDKEPEILSSPSKTDLDELELEAVVSIEANISSYAIPIMSEDEIKNSIISKTFAQAEAELLANEKISKVTFTVIPGFLQTFVKKLSSTSNNIIIKFVK